MNLTQKKRPLIQGNYFTKSELLINSEILNHELERKMCPFLASLNRSFKSKNHRIRCISIQDFRDTDEIEREMEDHSMIVVFFKEFRIKRPMDAKRFLQCLNAFIRQYKYEILNLGKLDYLLLLPSKYELTTETFESSS